MAKRHISIQEPEEVELPDSLLDMQGVMKRLGVGRDKVFELMRDEGLPHIKWGARTLKFHPVAVARWLESQNQSSAS